MKADEYDLLMDDPVEFFMDRVFPRALKDYDKSMVKNAVIACVKEYCQAVNKYGKKRADKLFKVMLKHYFKLGVVDTQDITDTLKLETF